MLSPLRLTAAIAALITSIGVPTLPAFAAPAKNVVLVHGALADGSGCSGRRQCELSGRQAALAST